MNSQMKTGLLTCSEGKSRPPEFSLPSCLDADILFIRKTSLNIEYRSVVLGLNGIFVFCFPVLAIQVCGRGCRNSLRLKKPQATFVSLALRVGHLYLHAERYSFGRLDWCSCPMKRLNHSRASETRCQNLNSHTWPECVVVLQIVMRDGFGLECWMLCYLLPDWRMPNKGDSVVWWRFKTAESRIPGLRWRF
jgi:hypothetical protein